MREKQELPTGTKLLIGYFGYCALGFLVGQGAGVVEFDWAVNVGLQQAPDSNDPAIIETTKSIGLVDLLVVPLFIAAGIGLWRRRLYGFVASFMVLGINLYWPVVAWVKEEYYLRADLVSESFPIAVHVMLASAFVPSAVAVWYLSRDLDHYLTESSNRHREMPGLRV